MRRRAALALAASAAAAASTPAPTPLLTTAALLPEPLTYAVSCDERSYAALRLPPAAAAGCLPPSPGASGCRRHVEDGFVTPTEASQLLRMVTAGFARSVATAGPTILDVNTGFLRDADSGVVNIYRNGTPSAGAGADASRSLAVSFSEADRALYRDVIERIRQRVVGVFNLTGRLAFTAPTFVTRIIGDPGWAPEEPHSEYFHPHVDMDNTAHYHYSGLLYLSTHAAPEGADGGVGAEGDFTGGTFAFLRREGGSGSGGGSGGGDPEAGTTPQHVVHPRAGRLVAFSAGGENLHAVRLVTGGTRYVLSMWFTCDPSREFRAFLDNDSHGAASGARGARRPGGDGGGGTPTPRSKRRRAPATRRPTQPADNRIVPDGGDGEL